MLLTLTASDDATADYLHRRLVDARIDSVRLNTDRVFEEVDVGFTHGEAWLSVAGRRVRPRDIGHIWYRRPSELAPPNQADDAERQHVANEWAAAIEGVLAQVPADQWLNHPAFNANASHKLEQLHRANQYGLSVPETLVTRSRTEAMEFLQKCGGRMAVKPLLDGYLQRSGLGKDTLIYTSLVDAVDVERAAELLPRCPAFFQAIVPKEADVRITIVDEAVHAVKLFASDGNGQQRLDVRRNSMEDVTYEPITLPPTIAVVLTQLLRSYRLRFAAIDMAITADGDWVFFEINPNGQWAWLDLEGVTDIGSSMSRAFSNAR